MTMSSSSDEEQSGLHLPEPARYDWFSFEPTAAEGEAFLRRRGRQALSAGNADPIPTNEPSTSSSTTLQFTCHCELCPTTRWPRMRFCERRCCFAIREMRDLMQEESMPHACFTAHPDFKVMAFNKSILRSNEVTFDVLERKAYVASLPGHKRRCYSAYRGIVRWVYRRMGRGNREPLPACVVQAVRDGHPPTDAAEANSFTGFRYAEESDNDVEAADEDV